jgi:hypothetical protein
MARVYLKPHETKRIVDEAVTVLMNAADTDDVLWSTRMTGQDSEEAEGSGYIAGYRDALAAVQRLLTHGDADTLTEYVEHMREEMREWQAEVEEIDPGPHFWN